MFTIFTIDCKISRMFKLKIVMIIIIPITLIIYN